MATNTTATQSAHPWRATARTVFAALVAFAAMWGVIVEAAGLDPSWQWVSVSVAVTGAITRVMALPQVDVFLERFFPWLATGDETVKGEVLARRDRVIIDRANEQE